jgi:hypothetical protein
MRWRVLIMFLRASPDELVGEVIHDYGGTNVNSWKTEENGDANFKHNGQANIGEPVSLTFGDRPAPGINSLVKHLVGVEE